MTWVIVATIVFTLLAAYALYPLVGGRAESINDPSAVPVQEQALLQELQEAELDHDLGKLTTEEFEQVSAQIQRQLDEVRRDRTATASKV